MIPRSPECRGASRAGHAGTFRTRQWCCSGREMTGRWRGVHHVHLHQRSPRNRQRPNTTVRHSLGNVAHLQNGTPDPVKEYTTRSAPASTSDSIRTSLTDAVEAGPIVERTPPSGTSSSVDRGGAGRRIRRRFVRSGRRAWRRKRGSTGASPDRHHSRSPAPASRAHRSASSFSYAPSAEPTPRRALYVRRRTSSGGPEHPRREGVGDGLRRPETAAMQTSQSVDNVHHVPTVSVRPTEKEFQMFSSVGDFFTLILNLDSRPALPVSRSAVPAAGVPTPA